MRWGSDYSLGRHFKQAGEAGEAGVSRLTMEWKQAVESKTGQRITNLIRLTGGDFAESYQGVLSSGDKIFIKTHRNPPEGFFTTEATGLQWLAESATVSIPTMIVVADEPPVLALHWVERGHPTANTEEQLGHSLAELHRTSYPAFGRTDNRTTGSLGLPNGVCDTWAEFFACRRLLPLAKIAQDRGALPERDIRALEKLASRLESLEVPEEPPALLHGDLWAGNRMVDGVERSWLIDPAAHGGHREFDLSMMRLFGGFGRRCFQAYDESFPLAHGFTDRVGLHQLAPLVVHAIKFGGSYAADVRSALKRYG